ncbi:MAG: hypothetical protein Kow0060_17390 [Methylohalobius crimeensis]
MKDIDRAGQAQEYEQKTQGKRDPTVKGDPPLTCFHSAGNEPNGCAGAAVRRSEAFDVKFGAHQYR